MTAKYSYSRTYGHTASVLRILSPMAYMLVRWCGSEVERRSANFHWSAPDLQLMDTIYMGKPSAVGQPTRPTQPFILTGSINE